MRLSNVEMLRVNAIVLGDLSADELHQGLEIDLPSILKSFIDLCIISAVNEYAYGQIVFVCHGSTV